MCSNTTLNSVLLKAVIEIIEGNVLKLYLVRFMLNAFFKFKTYKLAWKEVFHWIIENTAGEDHVKIRGPVNYVPMTVS